MIIDFHLHSTHSDGTWTPKQIIDETYKLLEKENETIAIISITDHDTTKHINPALDYAYEQINKRIKNGSNLKVYVVPGAEISTTKEHMVTCFNPYEKKWENKKYQKIIGEINKHRKKKFYKNCELLNDEFSYLKLNSSQIKKEWFGTLGKPALADAIYKSLKQLDESSDFYVESGYDLTTIYKKYLNDLPKKDYPVKPEKLIQIVHNLDGICILAHPNENMSDDDLDEYINADIDGIERPKSGHRKDEYEKRLSSLNLVSTHGSDCHFQEKDWNFDYNDFAFGFKTDKTLETYAGGAFAYLKDFETNYKPTHKSIFKKIIGFLKNKMI